MDVNVERAQRLAELLELEYGGDAAAMRRELSSVVKARKARPKPKPFDASRQPVVLEVQSASRTFKVGRERVEAVKDVSLSVRQGEVVALVGPSGSGKSSLMHLIGGLDKPDAGSVVVDGQSLQTLSDGQLSEYRAQKIGFVFQFFYLQPFLSLEQNVQVPAMFARTPQKAREARAREVIADVDLADRGRHRPNELSGGQMQRVAIARALINNPKIILADEPTGNLDSVNAQNIIDLFLRMRDRYNTTVIIVTHDPAVARRTDRIISLRDGRIIG